MPVVVAMCAHGWRLFITGADGMIYPSAILDASTQGAWNYEYGARAGDGSGDGVAALISGQAGKLIVLNQASVWTMLTAEANPAYWTIERVTDKLGCANGRTAVFTGQDLIFLSHLGVASLASLATTDTVSAAVMLSTETQTVIDRINRAQLAKARAVTWENFYLLAVPLDGSPRADTLLVYNTLTRKWSGVWRTAGAGFAEGEGGFGPMLNTRANDIAQTWVCDTDGTLFTLEEGKARDDTGEAGVTAAIESWALTRAMVFAAHELYKQAFWCEVELIDSDASGMTLALVTDDENSYPKAGIEALKIIRGNFTANSWPVFLPLPEDPATGFLTLPFYFTGRRVYRLPNHIRHLGRFRSARVLVHSPNGNIGLRQLRLAAFVDTVQLT
jgi:hypothetical protein